MAEKTNILPRDILAEQAVLGSIFVDPEKIFIASELLTQESFYKLSHGIQSYLSVHTIFQVFKKSKRSKLRNLQLSRYRED